jgi:TPR repeat protein
METAAKWAALSAAQGYVLAENSMGYSFDQGVGVNQDLVEAYKWYALAIAQGNGDAKVNMERLRPRLSADQIAEGQRRSDAFVPTASAAQSPK